MSRLYLFIILMLIGVNSTSITQSSSTLAFAQGNRYDYAVLCTDYCGSKIWDATYLDADLFFIISSIDEINDQISIYTEYNSTTIIERLDNPDYGIFSLNESYSYSTRQSNSNIGKYSWQWSTLETEFEVSIPYFFLSHARPEFENNSFILRQTSELEEIEISPQHIFQAYTYHGKWTLSYNTSNFMITDESTLTATYDSVSGILLRMEIELVSIQVPIGPLSEEINVDAVGSFKISLVLPSSESTNDVSVILGGLSLMVAVLFYKKRY